jgi:NTE family protein
MKVIAFFVSLMLAVVVQAQTYKNLVFEGGGVRGIAYVGAINVLEDKNILPGIERVGGTSAGAIAALTVALGYNSKEIEAIIYGTRIQKFNDGKFFFFGGISRLNKNYGWYRGEAFSVWLEKIIRAKTGNADITFRELHEKNFKDLYVTGTSLNHQELIVFSNKTFPEMKVKDAVRISMSVPLYFEAVIIDSTGAVKETKEATGYHHIMVDGGLTGNYPIFIFDSISSRDNHIRIADPQTLGLRIDTPEQIGYDVSQRGLAPIPIYHFKSYVEAFYSYVIENLNRGALQEADWQRTVSISAGDIGPKIKKLSTKEKDMLIGNGAAAMKDFLRKPIN